MKIKIKLLIIFLILFPCIVFAEDINVATPVTSTTINNAINTATPGDSVIIPDGTYPSLGQITIPTDIDGTEELPITLKAATVGGVTFTGNSASPLIYVQGDWWVIRDFKFIDVSEVGAVNTKGIFTEYATDTRITNNYFEGFGILSDIFSWCISIGDNGHGGDYSRVDYNTFFENESMHINISSAATYCQVDHNYIKESIKDGTNGFEGIRVGGTASTDLYTIAEYNLFENMSADGETISNKSSSNTYRYNVFKSTGGKICYGLILRYGDDCTIESNYFFDVDNQNIRVHGTGHKIINNYFENPDYSAILLAEGGGTYANVSDIFIANNTIINPIYRGFWIGWWPGGDVKPNNLAFKNNIIISDVAGSDLVRDEGHTGTFAWTTNLHYTTGGASYWDNGGGGDEPGSGITHADPSLVSGYGIYRLQASSSNAIEQGTPDGSVTDDIDEHTRDETNPDTGCDEYSASAPTRLPIQEHEVGVSWLRFSIFDATPTNGSSGISITTDLNWTNPETANNIDLLFDKKSEHDPPTTVRLDDQDVETWDCGTLDYNTEYTWRANVNHAGGTELGTVYYFTTTAQVNPPYLGGGTKFHKEGMSYVWNKNGVSIK